ECQVDRPVRGGARIEGIGDVVGLAEPKRQANHQVGADVTDDILGDGLRIGKQFRHAFPLERYKPDRRRLFEESRRQGDAIILPSPVSNILPGWALIVKGYEKGRQYPGWPYRH